MGPMGSTKSTPGLSKARGKFLTDKTLKGTRKAHASDKLAHLPDGSPPCAAYSHVPCGAHTAALSFPRLASLASGPGRSLLGLCVSQQHLKSVDRFQSVNGYQDPRIDGGEVVTTMHGRVEGCL